MRVIYSNPQPKNHYRDKILDNHYEKYLDVVNISDRNRELLKDYIGGMSQKACGEKYGVSSHRVPQIAHSYINKVKKMLCNE